MRPQISYCHKSGKPCYDKKSAITAKNSSRRKRGVELREYHCPDCNWWHLTHTNVWKSKKSWER